MVPTLRRLIPATAVALAVAFVGFGVIGVAAAEGEVDTAGSEPAWFQVAERHAGDRATMRLATDTVTAEGPYLAEVIQHWTWRDEQAWLDGSDGAWRAVHPVTIVQDGFMGSEPVEVEMVMETRTEALVGFAWHHDLNTTIQGAPVPILPTSYSWTARLESVSWGDFGQPCGLERAVRAGLALTPTVTVDDDCIPAAQPVTFAVSNAKVGEVDTVRFTTEVNGTTYASDYNAAIPQALRVTETRNVGLEAYGGTRELTGFEAGTGPWDTGLADALPAPIALPTVELSARDPWGPSEAGIQHPFPASVAWAFAAGPDGDEEFANFLAAHPGAIATKASFQEHTQGSRVDRSWFFTVEDGLGDVVGVVVDQDVAPPASDGTDLLGLDPVPVGAEPVLSANPWPAHACTHGTRPTELPSLASGFARWQAFTASQEPGNAWGLDCDGVVEAGRIESTSTPPRVGVEQTYSQTGNGSESLLSLSQHGVAIGLRTSTSDAVMGANVEAPKPAPSPTGEPTADVASTSPVLAVGSLGWTAPSAPVASGAAAVSVMAGLLYWLWPALKGGGIGLFSRIETPRLLQHPMRRAIADAVEANPGIHYQAIVRLLGGGHGNVDHHLRKLVTAGLLQRHQGPGFTCYFPSTVDRRVTAVAGLLKSEGARRVLTAAQAHPGATAVQLAAATGLDASTVSHHVHRLVSVGVLQATKVGRTLVIQPTAIASQVAAAGA